MRDVTLTRGPVSTTASGYVDDDLIDSLTRYHEAGYQFKPAFKAHKWDGWNHLYSDKTHKFPAGLTKRVEKALKAKGYRVETNDTRAKPSLDYLNETIELFGVELRDSQYDAIEQAINEGQGIIKAATGFGKTEVMAGLLYAMALPSVIFINAKTLAHQTRKRLEERLGVEVGFIGDGIYQPAFITVCMFQSAANLLKDPLSKDEFKQFLRGIDLVLIDETHHGIAKTYMNVLKMTPAYFRIGVSATPFIDPPGSELALIGQTGELIYDFDLADAVEAGIAVKPHCFFLNYAPQVAINDGTEWADFYTQAIVMNEGRNEAIRSAYKAAVAAKLPALIIVDRIEHGNELSKVLDIPFVSGKDSADLRLSTFDKVNSGKLPGFISTVAGEGVDIANLSCIILASGGKASHRVIQRIGRGIRKGAHDYCVVVDFADSPTIKNRLDFDRRPNNAVKDHTKLRQKAFNNTGFGYTLVNELPNLRNLGEA